MGLPLQTALGVVILVAWQSLFVPVVRAFILTHQKAVRSCSPHTLLVKSAYFKYIKQQIKFSLKKNLHHTKPNCFAHFSGVKCKTLPNEITFFYSNNSWLVWSHCARPWRGRTACEKNGQTKVCVRRGHDRLARGRASRGGFELSRFNSDKLKFFRVFLFIYYNLLLLINKISKK